MEINQIITNENDIYLYFEMIKQLKPAAVLDVGMFLKRIGAIARQAVNCEIPMHVCLDGIDMFPQMNLPIYQGIYNDIYAIDAIAGRLSSRYFDVAILLRVNEWLPGEIKQKVWAYLFTHTKCIIADTDDMEFVEYALSHGRCEALNLEGEQYAAVWCGTAPQ